MTLAVMLAALLMLAQQPPAPPPSLTSGTATVRGQITDKDTGAPLPGALVSMRYVGHDEAVRETIADRDGRYEITNLPAGRYVVNATAGEHRGSHSREPFLDTRLSPKGEPTLAVFEGRVRDDVNISLRRYLAISGRVVDAFGDPVVGIPVRASNVGLSQTRRSAP